MEYFFIGASLLPYFIAAALGLLLPTLLVGAYSSFSVGLWVVVSASMLDNLMQAQPILRLGVTLYPSDVPMLLIGGASVLRWILRSDIPRRHSAVVLMALLFLAKFALGVYAYGSSAGVQARPDFYALAALSYAMSFEITEQRLRQMLRAFVVLAIGIVLLSSYRWTVYFLPIRELLPPGGVYNNDGETRVVASIYALIAAQAMVVGLFFHKQGGGLGVARWLSPILFAAVLVLQHRSVWLAGVVGVLVCLVLARTQKAPVWQQVALLALVVVTASAPLMLNEKVARGVQSSAGNAVTGQGTVNARFSNWQATLAKWYGSGPKAIAIGLDMGADTTRYVSDESGKTLKIQFTAHNHYVTMLSNFGLIGYGLVMAIFLYVLVGLWRLCWVDDQFAPLSAILLVLVAMQMAYYVAYGVELTQQFILGVAVAWVAQRARRAAPKKSSQRLHGRPWVSRPGTA